MLRITKIILTLAVCLVVTTVGAAPTNPQGEGELSNLPEREEWYKDLALGMFIHWSVDSQLGSVISHSLAGSSDDYAERFFTELPRTFEPKRFDPSDWARLARLGGMKYVMFTTKHHSGFSMFDTKTTPFNIMNTPYGKDATGEIVEAFRKEGLAVGFYFSPEDFWFIHQQGHSIARKRDYANPSMNQALRNHNTRQIEELFNNYGPIDLAFLDAYDNGDAVADIWAQDRNVVITRGAKDDSALYAIITGEDNWKRGVRKEFVLRSVRATDSTRISVLGHGGELVEYNPDADPTPRYEQEDDGLRISVVRAQRLYNNHQWPNPVVVRLTNVVSAR